MPRRKIRKVTVTAPPDKVFHLQDGSKLKDVRELCDAIAAMSDETYFYHVNPQKNDFARWAEDVLGDSELAHKLSSRRTRKEALYSIATHIRAYYD